MTNRTDFADANEIEQPNENPFMGYMEQMGQVNPRMKMMMELMKTQETDSQNSQLEEQLGMNEKLKSKIRVLLKKVYQLRSEVQWLQNENDHLEEKNEILLAVLEGNRKPNPGRMKPNKKQHGEALRAEKNN
jgi:hypothetical protein